MSAPTTVQWLRAAVHRVAVGSGRRATYLATWTVHRVRRIWQKGRGWLDEGEGLSRALRAAVLLVAALILRKIATALAVGLYQRVERGGAPWLPWGAVTWWTISAYRAGVKDWTPKRPAIPAEKKTEDEPEEKPAAEESAPVTVQAPATEPPVSPVALIAAVRDIGTPHAQLKPLADHLRTTTDTVRATAARMGWPVKDVRMEGRSSSAGLRWDDCPSPERVYPSPGVVGAGERADDNDDDTGGEGPREGVRVVRTDGGVTIYDLADTRRRRGTVDH